MAKFGSSSVGAILADGVSLLPLKAKDLALKVTSVQADTTGLGDDWPEKTPVNMRTSVVALGEAFYDTDTAGLHDQFKANGATSRVFCVALQGDAIGQPFIGHQGAYSADYHVMAKVGDLQKMKVDHQTTGVRDEGVILQATAVKTADWDTEGADSVDSGASSSDGGAGYLHVLALSGFTGFVATIQDSADDITYASLIAFTNVTTAPVAERLTVAGTVDRYLSVDGNVTGSGSITVWVGFARN